MRVVSKYVLRGMGGGAVLMVFWGGGQVEAQTRVHVMACSPYEASIAGSLRAQPHHQLQVTSQSVVEPATLEDLSNYDVLLVATDACFSQVDRAAFGDVLAAFVDAGGGVVEAPFSQSTTTGVQGLWASGGYSIIPLQNNNQFSGSSLGENLDPTHPIVQGVESLSVSLGRTGDANALPGSTVLLRYLDGQILAAYREDKPGRIAWLGFSPVPDFQWFSGDAIRLLTNELVWAGAVNSAPVLTPVADRTDAEGDSISLSLVVTDPNQGDTFFWSAENLPGGLSIDEESGEISGDISYEAAENSPFQVSVTVSDGSDEDTVSWRWTVEDQNRAPEGTNPGTQRSTEGSEISLQVVANDPDGDPVSFEAFSLPPGLSIDEESGEISGTLGFDASNGSPYSTRVEVSDGELSTTFSFSWIVDGVNRPPVISPPGQRSVAEGQELVVPLTASDPDGDNFSLSLVEPPLGARVLLNPWRMVWTPSFEQSGDYVLTIAGIDDGGARSTVSLPVQVTNTNRSPMVPPVQTHRAREGQLVEIELNAMDPDGDELLFEADGLPEGSSLSPEGVFSWSTEFGDLGEYRFDLIVRDAALSQSGEVVIVIEEAPDAPVIDVPMHMGATSSRHPLVRGTVAMGEEIEVQVDEGFGCVTLTEEGGRFACEIVPELNDGPHTLRARVLERGMPVGPWGDEVGFRVDTVAPQSPGILSPEEEEPVSSARPSFAGLAPEDASHVRVYGGGEILCVAPVLDGAWTCTSEIALPEGVRNVRALALDEAENISEPSPTRTFTVDLTAPLPPRLDSPLNEGIVAMERPLFEGVAAANTRIEVRVDGQDALGCTTVSNATQGAWQCQGEPLEAGAHTAEAFARDEAGNLSEPSPEVRFVVDLSGPAPPTITSPTSGSALSNVAPSFEGEGESGTLIRVMVDQRTVCDRILVGEAGLWNCRSSLDLSEGEHRGVAVARDELDRASAPSPEITFFVDTLAPAPPVLEEPVDGSIVAESRPRFAGQGEASSHVEIRREGSADVLCEADSSDEGVFSCIPETDLPDGEHRVQAFAADRAGNLSSPSLAARFVVDVDGDADNDGLPDIWEEKWGFNPLDPDDADDDPDNDGLSALQEFGARTLPRDGDSDDDGVLDGAEPSWQEDSDGDGLINALDGDSDNDGLLDGVELGISIPSPYSDSRYFRADADPSTTTDPLIADSDRGGANDGAEDWNLNGQRDPGELDPSDDTDDLFQAGPDDSDILGDEDRDGLTDFVERTLGTDPTDSDTDDDGLPDGEEPNPSLDGDGDWLSTALDPDSDNDGLPDGLEAGIALEDNDTELSRGRFIPDVQSASKTSLLLADTDGDGLRDALEDVDRNGRADNGESDPLQASSVRSWEDSDGDGLSDREEMALGFGFDDADSDDDGIPDGAEPNYWDDHDLDGLPNALDPDSDNDGILDGTEIGIVDPTPDTNLFSSTFEADADPTKTTAMLLADTDRDEVLDGEEDKNANGRLDPSESDPLDPLDPARVRCDFDFQCTEALGDGWACNPEIRECVEASSLECIGDEDCEGSLICDSQTRTCVEPEPVEEPDMGIPDDMPEDMNPDEPDVPINNEVPPASGGDSCSTTPGRGSLGAWWLIPGALVWFWRRKYFRTSCRNS